MGYLHIDNLYKNQEILLFKECYALEKIHGTSAHITHKDGKLTFFAGGASHSQFVKLFDEPALLEKLRNVNCTIYGEAYGGSVQGMSNTYGKDMKFVAFDVKIDDLWLAVPQAHEFCTELGLEFVHYEKISTDIAAIDAQKDADSVQAIRNGCGPGRKREGVVLRPLIELRKNNQDRIISKHKQDEYRETKTVRDIDPERLKVLEDATAVADEWVTPMRIVHVLDKIENAGMEKMPEIMRAMVADIQREGAGEIVWSKEVEKAIGKATAAGVKSYFQSQLKSSRND